MHRAAPSEQVNGEEAADDRALLRQSQTALLWWAASAAVLVPVFVLVFLHFYLTVSTDDARIDGHVLTVSARVTGSVARILVENNESVNAGAPLVEIDPVDFNENTTEQEANVAQLRAALQVVRDNALSARVGREQRIAAAQQAFAAAASRVEAAVSQVGSAKAQLASAEATRTRESASLDRTTALFEQRLVSRQVYTDAVGTAAVAERGVDNARAAVKSAEANRQLEEANRKTAVIAIEQARSSEYDVEAAYHTIAMREADLKMAEAQLTKARTQQSRTVIRAPVAGIVAARTVELGENIQSGDALLSIVDTSDLWVTANFKETQLRHLSVGEPANVKVDAYGVELPGRIVGFSGGSGSIFSLLPPDNASGNFVKVVQRIPVRIHLERLPAQALRPGMSVVVSVRH